MREELEATLKHKTNSLLYSLLQAGKNWGEEGSSKDSMKPSELYILKNRMKGAKHKENLPSRENSDVP